MLNVFDLSLKRTAVLQNAFDIVETSEMNNVGSLTFSLPDTDPKCDFCKKRHYVRYGEDGELYRILNPKRKRGETGVFTYECEHVIAKLVDKTLFGTYIYGGLGIYTREVLEYLLSFQRTRDWVLDRCSFARQFEYSWSNAGLLNSVFSVPNRFVEPYIWRTDTTAYPWKLSLDELDVNEKPQFYLRANKNLLTLEEDDPSSELFTVIYPLGYGEGDNQLTIKDVNNGVPYLMSPPEYIEKYGYIELIWSDKRFEVAENLKARAQALLAEYQEPRVSRTLSAADLYELTNDDIDKAEVGKIVMLADDNFKTYITKVIRHLDGDGVMEITIQNRPGDITDAISELAERQKITETYAQGATQLYAQSIQANATTEKGAILRFNIPSEMRIVNTVKAKITLDRFRAYSMTTDTSQSTTYTSSDGGGSTTTSSSGGGGTSTSSAGGGGSYGSTSGAGGGTYNSTDQSMEYTAAAAPIARGTTHENNGYVQNLTGATNLHQHYYLQPASHSHAALLYVDSHSHSYPHGHTFSVPAHTHSVSISIPSHSHSVTIPTHSHNVSIPAHSHNVQIPGHSHGIKQGIFESGNATGADIYVNGKMKGTMERDTEIELTTYLLNDSREIPRDSWIEIEVRPNDLAYVTIDMFIKGFVQSRGGGNY